MNTYTRFFTAVLAITVLGGAFSADAVAQAYKYKDDYKHNDGNGSAGNSEMPITIASDTRKSLLEGGRAGIYYRLSPQARHSPIDHPLVDAVIISEAWANIEPEAGEFDFSQLREDVDRWGASGTGVVLRMILYGQDPDDSITPSWIFDRGTEAISFAGGGQARGQTVRIPKVWSKEFISQRLEPLVAALAREFNGDPKVWFVVPTFGHIGNLTAQPSKAGSKALVQAGWTARQWAAYADLTAAVYQKHFTETPLMAVSSPILIRDRNRNNYATEANSILESIGESNVSVVSLGISSELKKAKQVHQRLEPLIPRAEVGNIRLGMGDDWPLWVPESRRRQGVTEGYDADNFDRIRELIFGGVDGIPPAPITIVYCQEPEVLASNPNDRSMYRSEVHEVMVKLRDRLLENDRLIFGAEQIEKRRN